MATYRYRIVNVFTDGGPFTGNPLCVFEDARGLDDATQQALARQFNLSETTFVFPSDKANARVRIYTPDYEMPFAGHPTLGTAAVVSSLWSDAQSLQLEMRAGVIPVQRIGPQRWQLRANPPQRRAVEQTPAQLAEALGLAPDQVLLGAAWLNTGKEQLMVPLASRAAVESCSAGRMRLEKLVSTDGQNMAYVFHDDGQTVHARFFFPGGGAVLEDPATGSACANLGGWFATQNAALPLSRTIVQGAQVGRPSRLYLSVDVTQASFVAGDVFVIATGAVTL